MLRALIRIGPFLSVSFFSAVLATCWPPSLLAADEGRDAPAVQLPPAAARKVDFATDIRPLFVKHCHKCHGAEKQQAGLRLDRGKESMAGGDSGKAYLPGNSAESLLVQYVAGLDPDLVMPPQGVRLTPEQVGLIRAWIDQGAAWPADESQGRVTFDHWSFKPIARPAVPAVRSLEQVRNPIDAFVIAKLESQGVAPSPEADRTTLIRRLNLDLLGLLPTPEEVDAFISDGRHDAYEQLVERLLSSPHFGERWGRHWLDLARYADSDGYEKDTPRPYAYRYRDWVIDAINRDLPFDQFTVEQIAGDLLPDATQPQRIATGFHRNTLTNKEGGVDQEEYRVAATVDRVNTLGSIWLGLTLGCAQCHTHKYDPLTQREYYQFFAFFNSIQEQDTPAPSPREAEVYAQLKQVYDSEHAKLVDALQTFEQREFPARQAAWEQARGTSSVPTWTVLEPEALTSASGATLTRQGDGSCLAGGTNPASDTYTLVAATPLRGITGIRLEVLSDGTLPAKGPGRAAQGNFVLSEFRLAAAPKSQPAQTTPIVLQNPTANYEQGAAGTADYWPISAVLDGKPASGWAVSPKFGVRHVAVFELREPIGFDEGTRLAFTLEQQYGQQHTLGRFRLSVTTTPLPLKADELPDDIAAILNIASSERTEAQQKLLTTYVQSQDADWKRLSTAVSDHAKQAPSLVHATAPMVQELATPRPTHLLIRGDFLRKGDETLPGVPSVLHELRPAAEQPSRLDLARWLVDPSNPLVRRVTVNQWWQHLLGRGLVATVEDFGVRGELPSHPELLDWLADELLVRGWSRKDMIRLIVGSATYRQSSRTRPELADRDPRNIWLARQNRFRVEAEVVRDLYLSASGILNDRVLGPSVRPPLPAGVAELGYAGSIRWPESSGGDRYRRGLYIFYQRTVPYPMLNTFDAPESNVSCVRRERSNTPLQALTLLNDPVFVECAQSLGLRALSRENAAERVRQVFRLCLSRQPSPEEQARLESLYTNVLEQVRRDPASAGKLTGGRSTGNADPAEAAAAVVLARIVLNLDEFLVRE